MNTEHNIKHLAMIMDGNRRWATERGLPKLMGHQQGAKNLKKVAEVIRRRDIPYLTLYTLSTENIRERSQDEVAYLFALIEQITDYLPDFEKENTKFFVIGDLSGVPEKTRARLETLMKKTAHHTAMTLTLAINYGGKDEIVRAVNKILSGRAGVGSSALTEAEFSNYLDTAGMPPVDLVIRTGGDQRLSNFLPWQAAYAELYFTPVKWPALSEADIDRAIEWFKEQKRNHGK